MPMTTGRVRSIVRLRQSHFIGGTEREKQGCVSRSLHAKIHGVRGNNSPIWPLLVLSGWIDQWRSWLFRRRPPRRRRRRVVPIAGRTRRAAFHDVLDHFLIDGLVLDQGFR